MNAPNSSPNGAKAFCADAIAKRPASSFVRPSWCSLEPNASWVTLQARCHQVQRGTLSLRRSPHHPDYGTTSHHKCEPSRRRKNHVVLRLDDMAHGNGLPCCRFGTGVTSRGRERQGLRKNSIHGSFKLAAKRPHRGVSDRPRLSRCSIAGDTGIVWNSSASSSA
jgi:hypothetical protein